MEGDVMMLDAGARDRVGAGSTGCEDSYDVVTGRDGLDALRAEWNHLWQRASRDYLMQDWDWLRITLDNPPDARERRLFCLLGRRDGRLGLAWPFVVYRHHFLRLATPAAAEWGDYTDVLVEDCADAEDRVARAWREVRAACRCDLFDLRFVRESSVFSRVLAADDTPRTLLYELPAPWISLSAYEEWSDYWRTISPDQRRDLGRKRRRLAELGRLEVQEITDATEGAALIDWMIHHKRIWLDHAAREDKIRLRTEAYRQFLKAQVGALFPTGRCLIFVLKLDGKVIALDLASVDKARLECNVGTFDYEYRKYSPGHVLKEYHVRWALERGLDYDMRLGDGEHKRFWGNRVENTSSWRVANSPLGLGYVAAKRGVAAVRAGRR